MVIYYSYTGKTKIYAETLAALKKRKIFELKEKQKRPTGIIGFLKAGLESIQKKESEVERLPKLSGQKEIYICSPIWAGGVAPAVRHFINNSNFNGIKVNFLLTCGAPDEKMKQNVFKLLEGKPHIKGEAYAFRGGKATDASVVKEQLGQIL